MIATLLARYGLLAIFVGAGIEGEAVVLAGGALAAHGLVPLWAAMLAATAGSTIVDQLWFWAGTRFRNRPFIARLRAKPAFARALDLMKRYPTGFILAFRFIYGMRTVSPVALGVSGVSPRHFIPLNLLAAAIWAPLFTWLGYRFGKQALALVERIAPVGLAVVAGVVVATLIVTAMRRR